MMEHVGLVHTSFDLSTAIYTEQPENHKELYEDLTGRKYIKVL